MISNHYIYNYIEKATNTTARPVYCATRLEIIPPSFPACYLTEINRYDRGSVNLMRTDKMKMMVWEAQIFSNKATGAVDEAYGILEDVDIAFAHLGFTQTYCQQVSNIDPSIYRLVGRWERMIGDGDTFPVTDYPAPDPTPVPDTP